MIFSVFLLKFLLLNDVNFIYDVTEKYFAFHDCFFLQLMALGVSMSVQSAKKCPKTIAFSIIVVKSFLNFLKKIVHGLSNWAKTTLKKIKIN